MVDVLSTPFAAEMTQARRDRLALFLGKAILPDIDALRLMAVKYAELIAKQTMTKSIKSPFLIGLEESLRELKIAAQSSDAELHIALPKAAVTYTRSEILLPDYHQETYQTQGGIMYHLEIPTDKITGVGALPFASVTENYYPVLDIRVQTAADASLKTYNPYGEDLLMPNPGTWHRLPLANVELGLDVSA